MKHNVIDLTRPCTEFLERTPLLTQYFNEIRKFEVISKEKEDELFKIIKHGNNEEKLIARNQILEANQRFVVAMAKRYGTNNNVADLIEEGNLAMIEAIEEFDPSFGTRFLTYAVQYIRRDLNKYIMGDNNIIKKSNISKTYHTISKATNKFVQENGRKPTTDELKDMLEEEYGVRINNKIDLLDTNISSIDESYDDGDENGSIGSMLEFDRSSASINSYEKNVESDFTKRLVASLLDSIQGKDSERAKLIVTKSFGIGYDYPSSAEDIAEELGLTAVRVRQIICSTVQMLKDNYKEVLSNMD